jgi:hypothetical protein
MQGSVDGEEIAAGSGGNGAFGSRWYQNATDAMSSCRIAF